MTEQDPIASRRALLAKIQTEGAEAAYNALLGVCMDPKAPAPARATAGTALFRAGGFMDAKQSASEKKPEDMTWDEMSSRIAELRAKQALAYSQGNDDEGDSDEKPTDLFG